MPKKKSSKIAKRIKTSQKKHLSYGVILGIFLVGLFVLYIGFTNLKEGLGMSFEECVTSGHVVAYVTPRECTLNGKTYYETLQSIPPKIIQIQKGVHELPLQLERGNYIINSQSEWDTIFSDAAVEPSVDFENQTAIAVVMGQKPSGGYAINLQQIKVTDEKIEFMVKEKAPGKNCVVPLALTNPYQIIAIEKTEKEIIFLGETIVESCE